MQLNIDTSTTASKDKQHQLNKMLWNASRLGSFNELELLVKMGADINATNEQRVTDLVFPFDLVGWSAIHFAASYGHVDCIQRLVALGSSVNVRTAMHGWAPIHYATADGHAAAIDALLSASTIDQLQIARLKKRKLNPRLFDLNALSEAIEGFAGAEIEQAVIAGLYRALGDHQIPRTQHLLDELHHTQPLSVLMAEKMTALRSWAAGRTVKAD